MSPLHLRAPRSESQKLRLTTLGAIALKDPTSNSAAAVSLTMREAALLAWILDSPSGKRRRDAAAHFFWPMADSIKGKHSLSQLIYSINKKGGVLVAAEGDLAATCIWDVDELETAFDRGSLERVCELYGGAFLADSDLRGPAADWRDEVQMRVAALASEAAHDLSCTIHHEKIGLILKTADSIALKHPTLRKARIAVINCYIRSGAVQRALSRHAHFANADADFPPFEAFEKAWSGADATSRPLPFKGRDLELESLIKMLEDAREGRGSLAIIMGEAGIGKTRLADQVLRRAALRGFRVWSVGCCAATQRLPFSAVHDMFRDNISSIDPASQHEVESVFQAIHAQAAQDRDELRHRLVDALTRAATRTAARAPLVIFLDDAQWADQVTALMVAYWAHRLRDHGVMILLTVRTQDEENLPDWIATDLARATVVELQHLSIDSARALVHAFEEIHGIALQPSTRDALLWLSGGRPFLLLEALSGEMQESGDASEGRLTRNAESVLRRRFKSLTDQAAAVYGFLAVWGKPVTLAILSEATGIQSSELAASIDSLQRRGIVILNATTVTFVHDLMRETASRQLLPASRLLWHSRAADIASLKGEPAGFVAQQLVNAGRVREAASYAFRAAGESKAAHAYADQEFYLKLAIASGDSAYVTEAAATLAIMFIVAGRTSEAVDLEPLMDPNDSRCKFVRLMAQLDNVLLDDAAAAKDIARRTAELVVTPLGPEATALLGRVMNIALDAGAPSFLLSMFDAVSEIGSSSEEALQISAYRALWSASDVGLARSLEAAESITRQISADHAPTTRSVCSFVLGTLQLLNGSLAEALNQLNAALQDAESAGDIRWKHAVMLNRGVAFMEIGDFNRAEEDFTTVLGCSPPNVRMRCYANMAILHFEAGRYDRALDAAEAVASMNARYGSIELMQLPSAIIGLIALRKGSMTLDTGTHPPDDGQDRNPSAFEDTSYQIMYSARTMALSGEPVKALELLAAERQRLSRFNVLAGLRLACCSAEILASIDPDRAYRLASDALSLAKQVGANTIRSVAEALVEQLRC